MSAQGPELLAFWRASQERQRVLNEAESVPVEDLRLWREELECVVQHSDSPAIRAAALRQIRAFTVMEARECVSLA